MTSNDSKLIEESGAESQVNADDAMTLKERQIVTERKQLAHQRQCDRARAIYDEAARRAQTFANHAKAMRCTNPVPITEYPSKIAGISREILALQDRLTEISMRWSDVVLLIKQEIAAETVKVASSRGAETEKPAFPNDETRQTELTLRMAAQEGWLADMAETAAIERAINDLKILRKQVSDDFKVTQLFVEAGMAKMYAA